MASPLRSNCGCVRACVGRASGRERRPSVGRSVRAFSRVLARVQSSPRLQPHATRKLHEVCVAAATKCVCVCARTPNACNTATTPTARHMSNLAPQRRVQRRRRAVRRRARLLAVGAVGRGHDGAQARMLLSDARRNDDGRCTTAISEPRVTRARAPNAAVAGIKRCRGVSARDCVSGRHASVASVRCVARCMRCSPAELTLLVRRRPCVRACVPVPQATWPHFFPRRRWAAARPRCAAAWPAAAGAAAAACVCRQRRHAASRPSPLPGAFGEAAC